MIEHYPDALRPEDYRERARFRRTRSPSGIGAAVERVIGEGGGAHRWWCLVTDGREFRHLEVRLGGEGRHPVVDPETIEAAVERTAGRFPDSARLAGLAATNPLTLRAEDLRPAG